MPVGVLDVGSNTNESRNVEEEAPPRAGAAKAPEKASTGGCVVVEVSILGSESACSVSAKSNRVIRKLCNPSKMCSKV